MDNPDFANHSKIGAQVAVACQAAKALNVS